MTILNQKDHLHPIPHTHSLHISSHPNLFSSVFVNLLMFLSELTGLYLAFSQTYNRKLGVVADAPDGFAATQGEFNKLEEWINKNP